MAKTNRDRVGEALELLKRGLLPFFEREMRAAHGAQWEGMVSTSYAADRARGKSVTWDVQALFTTMWDQWNEVFRKTLGPGERTLVSELKEVRNRWAHQETFSTDDAYRALDSATRLLTAVSAPEADEVERGKMELLRVRFEEQRRTEARRSAVAPVEGRPAANLRPWREVVTPHPDVASGRYQHAEFAADLWQVYIGEGSDEYKDPSEFYRRTFLTDGLKQLLVNAMRRLSGQGGDPVVELQTNFGGGKTHSMLALYHLVSGRPASDLAGIEDLVKEHGLEIPKMSRPVVVVGTKLSPGQPHTKPDGTTVRTIWGEIAWQLGGKDGYALVAKADETATNPGDALRELLNRYSPCLILIDEWVAYARQLHESWGLAGGTFETQFTFAQALTEAVKAARSSLLVVSVPASESPSPHGGVSQVSEIEVGGERGHAALSRLKNAIGRVEASWRPASVDEGFEIVRRRLFEPITDPALFVARDQVARAFVEMYGTQRQEFPSDCREASYERRLKAAYPIHPELFDRLFADWSTLHKFQRTRGVLRLMAAVIHSLWERQDSSLLIMPASVPVDEARVQFELTRYLEDSWVPVIEKDVDGPHSLPLQLDRENPNLGRYSACRRVSRTVYMGSAPTQRAAHSGIDDRQVKLGCVQPGESVATFGDALRRLTDRATYLYVDGHRYWFSTQPTVTRLAEDRASQVHEGDVVAEIERRLREQAKTRGDFSRVHPCAPSSDVPDERAARLVILSPEHPHTARDFGSLAGREAAAILESRGSSPRAYKNTLVFLAADVSRLKDLDQAVRSYVAWKSIHEERAALNLDEFQRAQAETKAKTANETVQGRIPETYQWLLVPGQTDPKGAIEWSEIRLQGQEALAVRAARKLRNDELLLTQFGGVRLRHELDRIPLWRGDGSRDVGVRQLAEDFATYLYLPRLRDDDVLVGAIEDGVGLLTWESDGFAYAGGRDDQKQRYTGLRTGAGVRAAVESRSLVVRSEIARAQLDAESVVQPPGGEKLPPEGGRKQPPGGGPTSPPPPRVLRRFHGSIQLDPQRIARDASRIADEIVAHLVSLVGSEVSVSLDVEARVADGVPEKTVRDVTENCRTLGFDSHEFEEE